MYSSYLPVFVFLLGCLLYLPAWKSPKVVDFGRICVCVGLLVTVWMFSSRVIHLP